MNPSSPSSSSSSSRIINVLFILLTIYICITPVTAQTDCQVMNEWLPSLIPVDCCNVPRIDPLSTTQDRFFCDPSGERVMFLNLSSLNLGGEIPSTLASVDNIRYMNLENNQFTGTVPSFLEGFKGLRVLFLGGNDFKGPLPNLDEVTNMSGTCSPRLQQSDGFCCSLQNAGDVCVRPGLTVPPYCLSDSFRECTPEDLTLVGPDDSNGQDSSTNKLNNDNVDSLSNDTVRNYLIGGFVGLAVLIILVGLLIYFLIRRKQKRRSTSSKGGKISKKASNTTLQDPQSLNVFISPYQGAGGSYPASSSGSSTRRSSIVTSVTKAGEGSPTRPGLPESNTKITTLTPNGPTGIKPSDQAFWDSNMYPAKISSPLAPSTPDAI